MNGVRIWVTVAGIILAWAILWGGVIAPTLRDAGANFGLRVFVGLLLGGLVGWYSVPLTRWLYREDR